MDGEPGVALALSLCLIRVTNLGIKKKKPLIMTFLVFLKYMVLLVLEQANLQLSSATYYVLGQVI